MCSTSFHRVRVHFYKFIITQIPTRNNAGNKKVPELFKSQRFYPGDPAGNRTRIPD
jgi:hypothetical protein